MKTNANKSIRLAEAKASRTAKRKGDSRAAHGSAFRTWFEAQHSKRPNIGNVTDEKLREMIMLGDGAARELYARKMYDAQKQSALYAWTAKDCPEDEIMRRIAPNNDSASSH